MNAPSTIPPGASVPGNRISVAWLLAALFFALSQNHAQSSTQSLTIEEILALPPSAEQAGIPVRTRGVLTYYEPGHRMAFLQDHTDAIYVHVTSKQDVEVGDMVEVAGFVDPGLKGRNLRGANFETNPLIHRLGRGTLPDPFELGSLDKLENQWGARWMRAELQVSSVAQEGDRARLNVLDHPNLIVYVSGISRPALLPGHLRGLRVHAHGVLADSVISSNPLTLQRQILIPGLAHISIPKDETARVFSGPEASIADLKWLHVREDSQARTQVHGVVTWAKPGEGFFIQRGTIPAWIQCTEPVLPRISQRVTCAGRPATYHGAGILRNSIWTEYPEILGDIEPIPIETRNFYDENHHGRLGKIRGELVEILRGPSENLMILKAGKEIVFSHFHSSGFLPILEKGSEVSVTGIFLNQPSPISDFGDSAASFHLFSRSPDDLRIVAAPSFWTLRRMVFMFCGVLLATVLTAGWVFALRRKVRKQASLIRKTAAKQAIEEERVRIAREWHDMFEQHFAGLTMLMDAAASMIPRDSATGSMLERAARIADHSRSEARQAIWDLRAPQQGPNKAFAKELEETISQSWPEDAACRLRFPTGETQVKLPRPLALQLIRIASEAVTNAFKHSRCQQIIVSWTDEATGWILSIQDDGTGIPAHAVEQASLAGHFGLLGMRERALRLRASLQILSPPTPGSPGTLIRIHLPKSILKP